MAGQANHSPLLSQRVAADRRGTFQLQLQLEVPLGVRGLSWSSPDVEVSSDEALLSVSSSAGDTGDSGVSSGVSW